MVKVYSLEGVTPVVHPSAFVHASAVLIGDVIIGPDCYIGPNACLRGDFGRIRIEKGVNIQDCCIVHGFPERDTVVEENGHIGQALSCIAAASVAMRWSHERRVIAEVGGLSPPWPSSNRHGGAAKKRWRAASRGTRIDRGLKRVLYQQLALLVTRSKPRR
jgi:NDP-sugar pyrophosphorylase family protein